MFCNLLKGHECAVDRNLGTVFGDSRQFDVPTIVGHASPVKELQLVHPRAGIAKHQTIRLSVNF